MKFLNTTAKTAMPSNIWGLSEDEHYYCLVQNKARKSTIFWQKKRDGLASLIPHRLEKGAILVRPISHQYIWRKTVFLPNTLNKMQLHQQIIHILKQEQPLTLDLLNIDYQQLPSQNPNLNKVVIYALRKSYAEELNQPHSILDCELHCYFRAITYLCKSPEITEFPCFEFKQKIVQFSENELVFPKSEPKSCLYFADIPLPDIEIAEEMDTNEVKHLYLLALGASLWNGKA